MPPRSAARRLACWPPSGQCRNNTRSPIMHTISRLVIGIAVMIALSGCARQATGVAGAAEAMGATTLNSIQYSGSGSNFAFGQAAAPGAPWPRFVVKTYDVAINYQTPAMKLDMLRAQGENPGRRRRPAVRHRPADDAGGQRHVCLERRRCPTGPQPGCCERPTAAALAHASRRHQGGSRRQRDGDGQRRHVQGRGPRRQGHAQR